MIDNRRMTTETYAVEIELFYRAKNVGNRDLTLYVGRLIFGQFVEVISRSGLVIQDQLNTNENL